MPREDFIQKSPTERLAKVSADLSRYVASIMQGRDTGRDDGYLNEKKEWVATIPHYEPWSASEVRNGIDRLLVGSLTQRQALYSELNDSAKAEEDRIRVSRLQEISQALSGESPVDQAVLDQIKALF